jgi:hypothetical protein
MRTLILFVLCVLGFGAQAPTIISFGLLNGPGIPTSLAFEVASGDVYAIRMTEGKEPELQTWPAKDWIKYQSENRPEFRAVGEDDGAWGNHDLGARIQPTTKGIVSYRAKWGGPKSSAGINPTNIWWGSLTQYGEGNIQAALWVETEAGEFIAGVDKYQVDVRTDPLRRHTRNSGTLGGGWEYFAGEKAGLVVRPLEVGK